MPGKVDVSVLEETMMARERFVESASFKWNDLCAVSNLADEFAREVLRIHGAAAKAAQAPADDACEHSRDCIVCGQRIASAFGVCFTCHTTKAAPADDAERQAAGERVYIEGVLAHNLDDSFDSESLVNVLVRDRRVQAPPSTFTVPLRIVHRAYGAGAPAVRLAVCAFVTLSIDGTTALLHPCPTCGTGEGDWCGDEGREVPVKPALSAVPADVESLRAALQRVSEFRDHIAFTIGRAPIESHYDEIIDGLDAALDRRETLRIQPRALTPDADGDGGR